MILYVVILLALRQKLTIKRGGSYILIKVKAASGLIRIPAWPLSGGFLRFFLEAKFVFLCIFAAGVVSVPW